MPLIPITSIIIPENRIRKEFDEESISELMDSIAALGLFHAPLVKDDGVTLVGGGRRCLAIENLHKQLRDFNYHGKKVPRNKIPVISLSSLSDIQVREAELHENLVRAQLTWQERSAGVSELHSIRKAEAEAEGRTHTAGKTAAELRGLPATESLKGDYIMHVKEDLIVASFLNAPEVAKAKTRKDALKVVDRVLLREHRALVAKTFDMKELKSPHELLKGDMFLEMPKLKDNVFDCIIADPPWGVDADKWKNQNALPHSYKDTKEHSDAIVDFIAREGFRVTKKEAHLYIFCDILRFLDMKRIVQSAGWDVFSTPLIWIKGPHRALLPRPHHGPRRCYESILYAIKGDRRTTGVYTDTIEASYESGEEAVEYGARKPAAVYSNLITRTCIAGDLVLDPCCGSGPLFSAADKTRTIARGIEIDPIAQGHCIKRLENLEKGETDLFAGLKTGD